MIGTLILTASIIGVSALLLWGVTRSEKAEREKKPTDGKFDERQALARGRAGHTAFVVLIFYLLADYLLAVGGHVWAKPGTDAIVGIFLASTVFTVEAVRRDAYFSMGENVKKSMIWFVLYGLLFSANAVLCVRRGQLIEDGLLTGKVIYIGMSVESIVTLAALVVKALRAKREDAEDSA